MCLTKTEILAQPQSLKQTYAYFMDHKQEIADFLKTNTPKKFIFMGCGSSFMLCQSAQQLFSAGAGVWSMAVAGGDFLIHPQLYAKAVENSMVVILSRSGMTTEIIRAVQYLQKNHNVKILSVTMKEGNELAKLSDLNVDLPWAYDKSVCQTRTVTNLYSAVLLLYALCFDKSALWENVAQMISVQEDLLAKIHPIARAVAQRKFDHVIVLADGELCGIAEEGALAFTEISLIDGKYFRILDYRHGPMVLNNENTLTILAIQPEQGTYQKDMIEDLKAKQGTIVVLDDQEEDRFGVDFHVCVRPAKEIAVYGIPFINTCQLIALEKALVNGVNPDQPKGLDAFITLK